MNKWLGRKSCASGTTLWASLLGGFVTGFLLFHIITQPDAGGIWDGYVPTWLGGEGP